MTDQNNQFHAGELALQDRLGVREQMAKFSQKVIHGHMPQQHREFYQQLPYIFVSHSDKKGLPWASILYNEPGFITSPDDKTLTINALPVHGDPLGDGLTIGSNLGVLGIELHTKRRNRLSGRISGSDSTGFTLAVDQAFGNCPKYIKARSHSMVEREQVKLENISHFDDRAKNLIKHCDTFFVASFSDSGEGLASDGADISHRGGPTGFVRVEDEDTLTIPDYAGNKHFNTLGNFELNPRAGLLFIDFVNGNIMSVTGQVEILWDHPDIQYFAGAERLWRFTLKYGRWISHALPLQWRDIQA
jgi:predicted pyridoxine 5'-phosphate oxidase superfamily flavin-nucleotide-binding protein